MVTRATKGDVQEFLGLGVVGGLAVLFLMPLVCLGSLERGVSTSGCMRIRGSTYLVGGGACDELVRESGLVVRSIDLERMLGERWS
jgi:hypothetical protein